MDPQKTPKMDSFAKIVHNIYVLTIVGKSSILDACGGSWPRLCFGYKVLKQIFRGVLRVKKTLKICSKFTVEHSCQGVISIKLLCNFIEITLWHGCSPVNLLYIFRIPFDNTYGGLLPKFLIPT